MKGKIYDLAIIGGGPAGLTAAVYAGRRKLKTLIITNVLGGQMGIINEIENYPGFEKIAGFELAQQIERQARKWGAEFAFTEVSKIKKSRQRFELATKKGRYFARAIILAFGLAPRKLKVKGEEKFKGKGVAYCATCDAPFFKNKIVGVVGGGNSALESAQYLATLAKKVYLIHRSDEFRADPALLSRAKAAKNLEFYCFTEIKEIKGGERLEAVVLKNKKNQKKIELPLNGLFVEIGYQPKTQWLKGIVDLNSEGEIIINRDCETSVKGIFAAGDCTDSQYKQIIISAGEGAKAALEANKYIINHGKVKVDSFLGRCELVGAKKTIKVKLEK